jgi:hypothetical protein
MMTTNNQQPPANNGHQPTNTIQFGNLVLVLSINIAESCFKRIPGIGQSHAIYCEQTDSDSWRPTSVFSRMGSEGGFYTLPVFPVDACVMSVGLGECVGSARADLVGARIGSWSRFLCSFGFAILLSCVCCGSSVRKMPV